ncbi:protein-glutamate methylesterase/protein-glutamine glutaminase [Methylopila sp. Yamaguchi]|uniref:protein-glutamate methylesterase/protein-glutamine glutaminase n=1 Tax=Methylopila sp. Yamaguchi TaxID=1437817 RepID=UPI000CB2ED31|nr:chemotaxis response regulator protein-glutamate methylesterase [Methylopila sp. Yamaguchi]GBD48283.1 chemotaxis-specific methylesterase [Methylopila sp. Yamaguchi]
MMTAAAVAPAEKVRVMIVDDSAVVRGLVTRWLGEQPGFEVVASCRTGRSALAELATAAPHVVVLDIEMPDMDGLTALPLMLKAKPDLAIVMASTLTRRNADVSLRCLALGAADFLAKPGAAIAQDDYRRDLVAKIKVLGEIARRRSTPRAADPRAAALHTIAQAASGRFLRPGPTPPGAAAPGIALKPFSSAPVRALAIGSSTGGPTALAAVLKAIGVEALSRVPVLITQHMPATFTAALAEHLGAVSGRPAREAAHGEPIERGVIYVAPGGKHFSVVPSGAALHASIDNGPPENFCKPSVEPMFRSASKAYGSSLLAVVLTGMGADGAAGVRTISAAGGSVMAQDEATSVVWGMPGAAAATGCCSAVLPLPQIGPKIVRLLSGDRA